MRGHKEYI